MKIQTKSSVRCVERTYALDDRDQFLNIRVSGQQLVITVDGNRPSSSYRNSLYLPKALTGPLAAALVEVATEMDRP